MAAAFMSFFVAIWFVRIRAAILASKIAALGRMESGQMDGVVEPCDVAIAASR